MQLKRPKFHQKFVKMKDSNRSSTAWIAIVLGLLVCVTAVVGFSRTVRECVGMSRKKDELERAVRLRADMIHQALVGNTAIGPDIFVRAAERIRFLPDKSGYLFVVSYDGRVLAHPKYASVSPDGTARAAHKWIVPERLEEMVKCAKRGGGYVYYPFVDPETEQKSNKHTFVVPVRGASMLVGGGVLKPYRTRLSLADAGPPAPEPKYRVE